MELGKDIEAEAEAEAQSLRHSWLWCLNPTHLLFLEGRVELREREPRLTVFLLRSNKA